MAIDLVEAYPGGFLLSDGRLNLSASVWAPNLIRLRVTPGDAFEDKDKDKDNDKPSWAIVKSKPDWPPIDADTQIDPDRRTGTLATEAGSFSIDLNSADWRLTTADGSVLFQSLANETSIQGQQPAFGIQLEEEDAIHGLGESTGPFNKRGLIREFWNIDVLGHGSGIHPELRKLYVSIPLGILCRGHLAAALYWDHPGWQEWDMGQTRHDRWQLKATHTGEIDLYLFLGPTLPAIVSRFTELTGRMPMPPLWALGYHQSRYSYRSAEEVRAVARRLRDRRIPCDAIYFDIHHMDGYRVFTFGKTYPRPKALISELAKDGFNVVAIVDPGVKDDPNFGILKRGIEHDAFVQVPRTGKGKSKPKSKSKSKPGKPRFEDYIGAVWPGLSRFPDFTRQAVRDWWAREQRTLMDKGVAGIWNDMNEPANFALKRKTLPPGARHRTDYGEATHDAIHNIYGMQMARASREGCRRRRPNERPFVITRAGFAGVQRYAMVWTGDNSSVWEHLADGLQQFLNLSLSGVAFCGADTGGFMGSTTPELLIRWTQFAVFTPFFRNHSDVASMPQEPWVFGLKTEALVRQAIETRYRLLPYLYRCFAEAHRTGTPIMRPMAWADPADETARALSDQFMLGDDLVVAPILHQGSVSRSVYLPEGRWHDFWTDRSFQGRRHVLAPAPIDRIPVFVRGGVLIPMAELRQSFARWPTTIELHGWPGKSSRRILYCDDGHSLDYESGSFALREIQTAIRRRDFQIVIGAQNAPNDYQSPIKKWRLVLHNTDPITEISINQQARRTHKKRNDTYVVEFPNRPDPTLIKGTC